MIEDNNLYSPEFINRLKSGNREAFTQLVEETSSKIYNLALRMLEKEQDAEDVLQETYIKALRNISSFEGRSSVLTWLYRIATNEALMIMRKHKTSGTVVDIDKDDDEDGEGLQIVDWCCLPESEMMSKETQIKLQEAANLLSPLLKAVFLLRDVERLSGQETALILGINEDAVKTRLVRARLKLRERLTGYFSERIKMEVANE
ncbi:MAG: RNA polymerase subunit sigma-24 [Anaerolinea sp.]|nr:RNA polymerase subunit sigma-24 [Anaerolinea sp.]